MQDIVPGRILLVDVSMSDGSVATVVDVHNYDVDAGGLRALGVAVRERTTRAAWEEAFKSLVIVAGDVNYPANGTQASRIGDAGAGVAQQPPHVGRQTVRRRARPTHRGRGVSPGAHRDRRARRRSTQRDGEHDRLLLRAPPPPHRHATVQHDHTPEQAHRPHFRSATASRSAPP